MDAGTPPPTVSAADSRTISRRRPLRTCGVSLAAIADMAFAKAKDFGRVGWIVKLVAAVVSARPFSSYIRALKYVCLAALIFIDRCILAFENMMESLFPSSVFVFNKMDELFQIVEALPRKLDDAITNFPGIFHQVPLLDCAVVRVILWLQYSISLLTLGGTKEKEISIDISCQQLETDPASPSPPVYELPGSACDVKNENEDQSSTQSHTLQAQAEKNDARESSYTDVLEKDTIENNQTKDDYAMEKVVSEMAEYKASSFLASTPSPTSQAENEADGSTAKLDDTESSCMDVLEKGMIENIETKDDDNVEKVVSEKAENKNNESEEPVSMGEVVSEEIKKFLESKQEDPDMGKEVAEETQGEDAERSDEDLVLVDKDELLEIFESSWHASQAKRRT